MRIVYMGTPDFAVPTLEALVKTEHEVVGVITAPDRRAGRGRKVKESAVKKCAVAHGLNVLQPTNLKNEAFQETLRALEADLQVVVAFRMLPESVWAMPPKGTVNLHASLLPQYRGAAPINWAIINGEEETGLTTFFIQHEIDTGKIIFQETLAIGPDETAGSLHDRLMVEGAELMVKTVAAIDAGDYPQIPQAHIRDIKHAPKLNKETGLINWAKPAPIIHNKVRGLSPYPGAYSFLDGNRFKVLKTRKTGERATDKPGTLVKREGQLWVATGSDYLCIEQCQPAGKRAMEGRAFANGMSEEIQRFDTAN